jgi:hypothetical protein
MQFFRIQVLNRIWKKKTHTKTRIYVHNLLDFYNILLYFRNKKKIIDLFIRQFNFLLRSHSLLLFLLVQRDAE